MTLAISCWIGLIEANTLAENFLFEFFWKYCDESTRQTQENVLMLGAYFKNIVGTILHDLLNSVSGSVSDV